ncbi:biotin-dependent carboxyltransferase family protein [Candidatus Oscillochloris fontis]|uniref:5-oxoprolinase subunit C family protein n=1 Tax=Candidatus Oscillochloris fontis TaxID=2496868 RepID=UPI00101B7DAE|nr:biotin-dependent carboxyltransferase family protein [Candidatus Oscillochloris fontis]
MIEIITSGPLMTIQDLGRPEARRYGVSPGGALDPFALTVANQLVGNPPDTAGIEITAGGAALRFSVPITIALAGGDLGARLNEQPITTWSALRAWPGATLHVAGRRDGWGGRCYLAVAGGIVVPSILGSRSTDLAGGFGGLHGRPLHPGDQLPLRRPGTGIIPVAGRHWPTTLRPAYTPTPTLRFIPGPHTECFPPDALERLRLATLRVSATSNRMGYRLEGVQLAYQHMTSILSLGVVPGTIQVPPDGNPIILMADAQTSGGYPILGVLISADMPLAAQLLPGDMLRLAPTSLDIAYDALREQAQMLAHNPEHDEGDLLATLAGA